MPDVWLGSCEKAVLAENEVATGVSVVSPSVLDVSYPILTMKKVLLWIFFQFNCFTVQYLQQVGELARCYLADNRLDTTRIAVKVAGRKMAGPCESKTQSRGVVEIVLHLPQGKNTLPRWLELCPLWLFGNNICLLGHERKHLQILRFQLVMVFQVSMSSTKGLRWDNPGLGVLSLHICVSRTRSPEVAQ